MGDRYHQLWTQKRGVVYTRVGGDNCAPINDVGRLADILAEKDNCLVVIAVANHAGTHLGLVDLERILGSHRVQNFVVRNPHTPLSSVKFSLDKQFENYMKTRGLVMVSSDQETVGGYVRSGHGIFLPVPPARQRSLVY